MRLDSRQGTRGRLLAGTVVTAALLVPLAVFGAPAIAQTAAAVGHQYGSSCGQYGSSGGQYGSSGGQYGSSGGQYGSSCSQYRYRVVLCHRTHSRKHPWVLIVIDAHGLKGHLRHGDRLTCIVLRHAKKRHHGNWESHGNTTVQTVVVTSARSHENGKSHEGRTGKTKNKSKRHSR
jgi:hypothetical protein